MTTTETTPASSTTFESLNPATGEVVGTFARHDADDVAEVVARARNGAAWWSQRSFDERAKVLRSWKAVLARRVRDLAELMHAEGGKPVDDAILELVLAVDHIEWAARNANRVLGRRSVRAGLLMANQRATIEYQPLGVVGVIGPWNYPVFTPMGSIAYALAAGNAVVFKPSEFTPAVGTWLVDRFTEVATGCPDDAAVFSVVTGMGETGAALCTSDVDKIAFTGSAATGRKVMAACAENLTPVLMECGGKDALIVDADADLPAAAEAALWAGMSNAGQTCIGTERVYVVDEVYDEFLRLLTDKAHTVKPGSHKGAAYGPMTMPAQLAIVRNHVTEALELGATAVVGGVHSIGDTFVEPVILTDVPEDACAITEETFGPTLVVNRVRDIDDAIERTNATSYGLAAAVYSKARGVEIAHRIRSGMASVNSVIAFASIPALPFGGVGDSGFGRIHGDDGLREFARSKSVTSQRFALPLPLLSFERHPRVAGVVASAIGLLHGRH